MAQPICRTILLVLFLACPSWAAAQDPALMARADSLSHASRHHFDAGNPREAEAPLRSALAIDLELFGSDHLQTAHTMHDLGWLLYTLGAVEEADSLLGRAEAVYASHLGVDPGPGQYGDRQRLRFTLTPPMPKRVWMPRFDTLTDSTASRARTLNNLGWLLGWTWEFSRADDLLGEALALERDSLGDSLETAVSLHNLGAARLWMGGPQSETWQQGLDLIDRSRALIEKHLGRDPRAIHLMDMALKSSYFRHAYEPATRDSVLERSLRYTRETYGFDDRRTSNVLFIMAADRSRSGLLDQLHDTMGQATAVVEKAVGGRQPRLAMSYAWWAVATIVWLGELARADTLLDRAEAWAGVVRLGTEEGNTIYTGRIALARGRGDLDEAERWARLREEAGVETWKSCSDWWLTTVLLEKGDLSAAEAIVLKARDEARSRGFGEPNGILGRVYAQQGRFDEAADALRASIEMTASQYGGCALMVTADLAEMARLFGVAGRHAEAAEFAREALESAAAGSGPPSLAVAQAHLTLAAQLQALEGPAAAEQEYVKALDVAQAVLPPDHYELGAFVQALVENRHLAGTMGSGDLDRLDHIIDVLDAAGARPQALVESLALRARLLHASGDPTALTDMEEALEILESMRPHIGGGEETRAGFFERYAGYYDDMVAWLLAEGDVREAFEYAERGRARVMLDQLAAGQVDLRSSIPSDIRAGLEERESRARVRVAEFEQRTTLLRGRIDLAEAEKLARLARLEDSLRVAGREFQAVYQEIKNASPLWRGLVTATGDPVSLSTVKRSLLPGGGLLLSYQIGRASSVVFVVGEERGQATAYPLTVSEEVAQVLGVEAGPLRQDALRAVLTAEEGVLGDLTTRSRVAGRRGPTTTAQLHALWQVLIPEEARAQLLEASEVLLVPDDALHSLPFEALVVEAGPTSAESTYWLDAGPPVRYAASATVLQNIEERPPSRQSGSSTALLSVADPVYDPSEVAEFRRDGSAAAEKPEDTPSLAALNRNSYTRAGGTLVRLPGTRVESDRVVEALGEDRLREAVSLHALEATEAGLRAEVEGKKYVHLATHGLVGGNRGALFASLALTPVLEEAPTPENDGYLQLHEIYELPLAETELAVLSACETNVGRAVEGEGVFALSRGFLAAGARRVVASQWAVDDASTAELMGRFFEAVATGEQDGAGSASIALHLAEAKKAVRSDERWSDPYYWAPFVLAGKR